jgi:hypothetical protein
VYAYGSTAPCPGTGAGRKRSIDGRTSGPGRPTSAARSRGEARRSSADQRQHLRRDREEHVDTAGEAHAATRPPAWIGSCHTTVASPPTENLFVSLLSSLCKMGRRISHLLDVFAFAIVSHKDPFLSLYLIVGDRLRGSVQILGRPSKGICCFAEYMVIMSVPLFIHFIVWLLDW